MKYIIGVISFLVAADWAVAKKQVIPTAAGNEIQMVMEEVYSLILANVIKRKQLVRTSTGFKCKPQFAFEFPDLVFRYTASDTCNLNGAIRLGMLPPSADVDLEVTNLKHVDRIKFAMKGEWAGTIGAIELNFEYLDGRVQLKPLGGTEKKEFILSGKVNTVFGFGDFAMFMRTNLFDPTTLEGKALLKQLGVKEKKFQVQFCNLTKADRLDPLAGEISACLGVPQI